MNQSHSPAVKLNFNSLLLISACSIVAVCHPALGEHGLLVGEVYSCSIYGCTPEELADAGVTVVSSFEWWLDQEKTKDWIRRCHGVGIRVIPYVSPEKAWKNFDQAHRRNRAAAIPYYRAVSPSNNFDWVLIGSDGRGVIRYGHWLSNEHGELVPTWGGDWPNPGAWYMCPNVHGYVDAVINGLKDTMALGVDGVFLDNASTGRYGSVSEDHGPKFDKRGHVYPGKSVNYAYTELIKKMYRTVKSFGQDKIVLLNSGLEDAFADSRDGGMLESYIFTLGGRRIHSWPNVAKWAEQFAHEPARGRIVAALSYVSDKRRPSRDDGFYSFACSKYSGFLYALGGRVGRPLTRLRLGQPTGERVDGGGVAYRVCERGVVAVNHSDQPQKLFLPAWMPGLLVVGDVYHAARVPVCDGRFEVTIPPDAGRVYASTATTLDSYLGECELSVQRLGRRAKDPSRTALAEQSEAQLGKIRQRLRDSGDLSGLEASVIALQLPPIAEALAGSALKYARQAWTWQARANTLASGVWTELAADSGPLVPGGSRDLVLHVYNESDAPVHVAFTRMELPKGFDAQWPKQPEAVGAGDHVTLELRVSRRAAAAVPRPYVMATAVLSCQQSDRTFMLQSQAALALGRAYKLKLPVAATSALPEGRRPIRLVVNNQTGQELDAIAELVLPEGWSAKPHPVVVEPSSQTSVAFDLELPDRLPTGKYEVTMKLWPKPASKVQADKSLAYIPGSGLEAYVLAPLAIEREDLFVVPGVVVPRVETPPRIDGHLGEPSWAGAAVLAGFSVFQITGRPQEDSTLVGAKSALAKTQVYLAYDDQALYVGFRSDKPNMQNLRASVGQDDPDLFQRIKGDDAVECLLVPDRHGKRVQLMVTSKAVARNLGGKKWQWAALIGQAEWSAEIVFPFSQIDLPPQAGDVWGANFVRIDHSPRQRSEWSCSFSRGWNPETFGVLVFGP